MARQIAKLSALGVKGVKVPGRHSDGAGLYLVVNATGAKQWVFIYRWKQPGVKGAGRLREMGLGSFNAVSLSKAREGGGGARSARRRRRSD